MVWWNEIEVMEWSPYSPDFKTPSSICAFPASGVTPLLVKSYKSFQYLPLDLEQRIRIEPDVKIEARSWTEAKWQKGQQAEMKQKAILLLNKQSSSIQIMKGVII